MKQDTVNSLNAYSRGQTEEGYAREDITCIAVHTYLWGLVQSHIVAVQLV